MSALDLPIRAATETVIAHGITPDRCDILQNGSTLVLRLTETLVARVVQDVDGPRQGTEWFARENAIAQHLTRHGAPVIPLHSELPPGPHEHLGYPMNFWEYVTAIDEAAQPQEIGHTLYLCHEVMSRFEPALPALAILTESLDILNQRPLFAAETQQMLKQHLEKSILALTSFPHQALHGDAHLGNLMNTTRGLLWTDWEDTFSGPVEWDVASAIWNAKLLDADETTADAVLKAYRDAGGHLNDEALHHSLIGRAAVMTAWYPILYPNPNPERQKRLQHRLDWLAKI